MYFTFCTLCEYKKTQFVIGDIIHEIYEVQIHDPLYVLKYSLVNNAIVEMV